MFVHYYGGRTKIMRCVQRLLNTAETSYNETTNQEYSQNNESTENYTTSFYDTIRTIKYLNVGTGREVCSRATKVEYHTSIE